MDVKIGVTFLVLIFTCIISFGACDDNFNCYQCSDDKHCTLSAEKGNFTTVSCSKKDSVCFVKKIGNTVSRGCIKTDEKPVSDEVEYERKCKEEKCNHVAIELMKCHVCKGDKTCNDAMEPTIRTDSCLKSKGCFTLRKIILSRKSLNTYRGCGEDYPEVKKSCEGCELQGPCYTDLCNAESRPKDSPGCFLCKGNDTCNYPIEGQTESTVCNGTCYARKQSYNTERGCSSGIAENILDNWNLLTQDPCHGHLCNKEKTYVCHKCKGSEHCARLTEVDTITQETCAARDQGCFTIVKTNGEVIRGCADTKTNLTQLSESGSLKEQCKTNLCNSLKAAKDSYKCHKCDDRKSCDKMDEKVTPASDYCEKNHEGCYTLIRDNNTSRGCVETEEALDKLKGNGILLGLCKNSSCNNQIIYECIQCEGVETCLLPNRTEIKYEKCVLGENVGCVTLAEKDKITRKCAKNKEQVEELKKRGNMSNPCTEDRCNELEAILNGSGTISTLLISVILPVIGALFVRF